MDFLTLNIVLLATMIIQTLGLGLSWLQNREEVGLRDWSWSAALFALAGLMLAVNAWWQTNAGAPGNLGAILQSTGAGLANAGMFLAWLGIRHFFHLPAPPYRWMAVYGLCLFALVMAFDQSPGTRTAIGSLSFGLLSILISLEIARQRAERNAIIYTAFGAMTLVALVWLIRGVLKLSTPYELTGMAPIDTLSIFSNILLSMTFTISLILITNRRVNERLQTLATTDPLTGIMNRRAFYTVSQPLLATLKRDSGQLAVCLLDLDHFKQLNDRYGHDLGDRVLQAFADMIGNKLRDGDLFARYGGEEFVVLLQHSSPDQALQAMERLRQGAAQLGISGDGTPLPITFSAGICCVNGRQSVELETLLKAADVALYEAKEAGRDRFVLAEMGRPAAEAC